MRDTEDPVRLVTGAPEGSALARALEAARGAGPTSEQRRMLERGVLAAIGSGVPPAVGGGGRGPASGRLLGKLPAGAVKLGAVLALGSLGAVGWRAVHLRHSSVRPSPEVAATEVSQPTSSPRIELIPAPAAKPPAGKRNVSPRRPAHVTNGVPAPAPPAEDEVALLDRARSLLASAPVEALALTDTHVERFPSGSLSEEREVIAISALARLGRASEARARAERFFLAHPRSAYEGRVRAAFNNSTPARPITIGGSE